MRGFQSLFCMFLRLSLCVCFLRYFLRFFLRCFLSSAVSLGVSFAWFLCVSMYVSMCISLCVSLCVSLCLFVSLYIFPCIKKKQEGESRGSFFSLCGRTFRCSPKYGHFLYLNSKEETATHLRLYLRLLYITARKPVGLADLVDLVDLVSPVDAADLVDLGSLVDLVETKVPTLKSLSKPRWFLH